MSLRPQFLEERVNEPGCLATCLEGQDIQSIHVSAFEDMSSSRNRQCWPCRTLGAPVCGDEDAVCEHRENDGAGNGKETAL
jgi:hypothetical protein